MGRFIPLCIPNFEGNESKYVNDALAQGWVSTGGVDITDCEAISRAVDPILDEKDPIAEAYHFEVCSAGLERALKRPGDFERFMGSPIMIKLYRPHNGLKEFPGILRGYEEGRVTAECGKETITFEKSQVALVRLRVEF